VGPNTRLEFKRADGGGFLDMELSRADYLQLKESGRLAEGALLHLRARRLTRFADDTAAIDPAAMI
jgi:sulfate transport system ATP-binding protein